MTEFAAFGELLMRLATPKDAPGFAASSLDLSFAGAETNVAVALAGFGHSASMITRVPDNPLGHAAIARLRTFAVATDAIQQGGERLGAFFLEPGAGLRPARVTYDRAGSSFADVSADTFDWEKVLAGKDWLITSGITAALGDGPIAALHAAFKAARAMNVRIAFDCNYRPALWKGREAEAPAILRALTCEADLVFAGRRAVGLLTGESFTEGDADAQFHAAAKAAMAMSDSIQHVAATRRKIVSNEEHRMTTLMADRGGLARSETRTISGIVDRVGTGDAFGAGILHGLSEGHSNQQTVDFALACSCWAHSVTGDFLRATQDDIQSMAGSNGDVRR